MWVINERKLTSTVWRHFEIVSKKDFIAKCNYCERPLSYRTTVTNLRKHLVRKHDDLIIVKISDDEEDKTVEEITYLEEDDENVEVINESKLTSTVWQHFEIVSKKDFIAKCNYCERLLSYRTTVTNLRKHLVRKHDDNMIVKISDDEEDKTVEEITYLEEDDEEDADLSMDRRRILRSGVWEYFEITDDEERLATCTLCREQFSYRSTSTNLAKHLRRRHCIQFEKENDVDYSPEKNDVEESDDSNDSGDYNDTLTKNSRRPSAAWKYFTVKDAEKRTATCNICRSQCSYLSSVSNLLKHVRSKHTSYYEKTDDDAHEDNDLCVTSEGGGNQRSSVWLYFRCDNAAKVAMCLICKKQLSHLNSITNLKKHLSRKHPRVQLEPTENVNDVSPTPEQLESVSLDRKEVFLVHQRLAHAQNTISSLLIENEELRSKIDGLEKRNEELQIFFVKVNADHRKMVSKTKWNSNSGKEATCESPKRKKARVSSTEDQDEKDSLLIPRGNATETDGSDTDISDDGDTDDDDDKDNICSSPLAQTPSSSPQDMPSTSSAVEQMRTTSSAVEQIPSTSTQMPLAYPFGQTQTQNYPSLIIMPMVTNNEVPIVSSVNSASLNLPLASPFNTVIPTTSNNNLAEEPIEINIKEEIKEEPDTSDNNLAETIEVNIKEEIKEEPDDE